MLGQKGHTYRFVAANAGGPQDNDRTAKRTKKLGDLPHRTPIFCCLEVCGQFLNHNTVLCYFPFALRYHSLLIHVCIFTWSFASSSSVKLLPMCPNSLQAPSLLRRPIETDPRLVRSQFPDYIDRSRCHGTYRVLFLPRSWRTHLDTEVQACHVIRHERELGA
jgi:hypothetical protein